MIQKLEGSRAGSKSRGAAIEVARAIRDGQPDCQSPRTVPQILCVFWHVLRKEKDLPI